MNIRSMTYRAGCKSSALTMLSGIIALTLAPSGCVSDASDDDVCAAIRRQHAGCGIHPKTKVAHAVILNPGSNGDATLALCTKLSALETLTNNGAKLSKAGFESLGQLKQLERLGLNDIAIDAEELSQVGKLHNLEVLGLLSTPISDEDLKHLSELEKLKDLRLQKTKVTGSGLQYLNAAPKLEQLALDESPVDDHGLATIGKLRNLRELTLTGTLVTDQGLMHLLNLLDLRTLRLTGSKVTPNAVNEFQTEYKKRLKAAVDRGEIAATDRINRGVIIELGFVRKR